MNLFDTARVSTFSNSIRLWYGSLLRTFIFEMKWLENGYNVPFKRKKSITLLIFNVWFNIYVQMQLLLWIFLAFNYYSPFSIFLSDIFCTELKFIRSKNWKKSNKWKIHPIFLWVNGKYTLMSYQSWNTVMLGNQILTKKIFAFHEVVENPRMAIVNPLRFGPMKILILGIFTPQLPHRIWKSSLLWKQ